MARFLNPIGVGACGVGNWCDWSSVGITRSAAPSPIPGNYASLPNTSTNGADLFQWMSPLAPGTYTLSFLAQNTSAWSAELVFGLNTQFGVPIPFAFGTAGWQTEITLAPSSGFTLETLTFALTGSEPYTPNEITFSQSYDAAIDQVSNSKNPAGTIVNIADVSLTLTPLPAALPLFATGLGALGLLGWRRKRKAALLLN